MAIDKGLSLDELLKQKEKNDKEASELEQRIRQARQASATEHYDQVVKLLRANGQFFSLVQRNAIKQLVDGGSGGKGGRTSTQGPKFQLDNGLTWAGHGKKTKGFAQWEASAAGKKWQAANPGQRFPSYPNANAKSGGKATPATKARPKRAKTASKRTKRATKKK